MGDFILPAQAPLKPSINWKAIIQSNQDLQIQLQVHLDAVTFEGGAAAVSVETTLLAQELHSDRQYGVGRWPLRLLSLGSSLFFFPNCFVLSLLMGAFQMEAVTTEYLLYMH